MVVLVGPPRSGKTTLVKSIPPDVYATDEGEIEKHLESLNELYVLDRNARIYLSRRLDGLIGDQKRTVNLIMVGTQPGIDVYFTCRTTGLIPGQDFPLTEDNIYRFWKRGGLPESFFAPSEEASSRFIQKYDEFYNVKELFRHWNLNPIMADSKIKYSIPWDSGLFQQIPQTTDDGDLFAFSRADSQLAWESCVIRVFEGGLRILDPKVRLYLKYLRGFHLFVISCSQFHIGVVPTIKSDIKHFPLNPFIKFLNDYKIDWGCVVRPQGALVRINENLLLGGLGEVMNEYRHKLEIKG